MKNNFPLNFLILVFLFVFSGCMQKNNTSNRIYFTFYPEERKVIVPVQLNDSVNVQLIFDTGCGSAYEHTSITLDSTILAAHPSLSSGSIPIVTSTGSGWNKYSGQQSLIYNSNQKLKIGNTNFVYTSIEVTNWRRLMNNNLSDGIFNIPRNDTIHVWELNFENNYMEVHTANDFAMPKDCFMAPLVGAYPFYMDIPLQVRFSDGDTLTINRRFFIDTGAAWDIVLLCNAPELEFLNKREDAVWIQFLNNYMRYYTVDATLFDGFKMDSVRVYTIDYKNSIMSINYIIGLNFLKRFNLFFDMKNKQLGLQPIPNFQRLVNPLFERFHYSTQKTKDGRFIVNRLGDYDANYYKTAGLRVRDEIVTINGVPYREVTREMADEFKKQDTVTLDIIRKGKLLSLTVKIDPNEPKGD